MKIRFESVHDNFFGDDSGRKQYMKDYISTLKNKYTITKEDESYYIELNTLEEAFDVMRLCDSELILGERFTKDDIVIKVYDYYNE
jgi:hypothetical protein